jgi:hypothetical protein
MSEKLVSLMVFGALIAGYPLGSMLARLAARNRVVARICALAGVVMIFAGIVGSGDVRSLVLAEIGLYLQVIWLIASLRIKRTNKAQYQELWAPRRQQSTSPNSVLAPVAHPTAQGARES